MTSSARFQPDSFTLIESNELDGRNLLAFDSIFIDLLHFCQLVWSFITSQ